MSEELVKLDGAALALLNMRLEGVVRKMSNTLLRTGRSGVLNRARDFSCCIVTANCDLLCAAESLPIHVLSGPDLMAASMRDLHPEFERGDAFLHNSPYHGCSHPADHTILIPIFDSDGKHRFTVLAKAHQADIGNALPTTYDASARDVYSEGALIFPCVKIQSGFASNEDLIRMCMMRIRVPEQWRGDFLAMMAAARTGESEIEALAEECGWDVLDAFSRRWLDYSERRMDAELKKLPGKQVATTVQHDTLPGVTDGPVPITARVTTEPAAGRIQVDLQDNPDCQPNGLNLSEACARTAAMIGVFNSIDGSVPKNAGSFRRLDVLLRSNCIAGIPEHPTSCSAATTNIADRVTNAVQLAMAQLGDGIGMAEIGANLPPSRGVYSGVDPRTKKAFINQVFLGSSGGAGGPHCDGWFHYSHAGNGGMGYMDSIEQAELYQPIIVQTRAIVQDTEGAGRTCGAPSKLVEVSPVDCEIIIVFAADGVQFPPQGAVGGQSGTGAKQSVRKANGTNHAIPQSGEIRLQSGDTLVSQTCAGGGYGRPTDRDQVKVLNDVCDGRISINRAKNVYGVVIEENMVINQRETDAARRYKHNRTHGTK